MSARDRPMLDSRARTASESKRGLRLEPEVENSSIAFFDAAVASANTFLDALRAWAGARPQAATSGGRGCGEEEAAAAVMDREGELVGGATDEREEVISEAKHIGGGGRSSSIEQR
nr:unnamed protein product [Digitaria exilis]